jgi:hypothetical protein
MWQAYQRMLHSRPVATKCITSAGLFGVGDLFAQTIKMRHVQTKLDEIGEAVEEGAAAAAAAATAVVGAAGAAGANQTSVDLSRTASLIVFGGLVNAPASHFWYGLMQRHITCYQRLPVMQALTKVAIHTVAWAPLNVIAFIVWAAAADGMPRVAIFNHVNNKWFDIWLAGAYFWVPYMTALYVCGHPLLLAALVHAHSYEHAHNAHLLGCTLDKR